MSISAPIVFFGTEDFSLGSLQALLDAGYPVAAVVTKPDTAQGRGHKITSPPVKLVAQKYNIPVLQPQKLSDISDTIKKLDSPVGVLVSYGKIIPQSIIDLFTPGIINVHPSLLPLYRGPSPIESAIINGDRQTGVSIMGLSARMDAGPVYRQEAITLSQTETAEQLYDTLGRRGSAMLVESLPSIIDGTLIPTEQDDASATYCQLINKADGVIDWTQSADSIERRIRAFHEWPQSRATIGSVDCIITSAHIRNDNFGAAGAVKLDPTSQTPLCIQAGSGQICIDSIKPIGKKEMPVQAFLSGYISQLKN